MKKSQAIVTDLIVAVGLGIMLVIAITLSWEYYSLKLNDDATYSDMFIRASQISETLVSTPGYPKNWNSTNVIIAGLTDSDRNISEVKLNSFNLLSNQTIKDMFKINLYNFTFEVKYLNNTKISLIGESGNATTSVNSRRLIIYRNETAILNFVIWN